MNAETRGLKHKELTETIIGVFFDVYNELGHGFLESVYEKALEVALIAKGLDVRRQIEVPVWFRGEQVGDFSADMLIEKCVLLELKGGAYSRFISLGAASELSESNRNRGWLVTEFWRQAGV